MKKTLFAAVLAAASLVFAARGEDSVLYWMVTTEDGYWQNFSAAALRVMRDSSGDKANSTVIDVKRPDDYSAETLTGTYINTYTAFGASDYEGWTFFVELLNDTGNGNYEHLEYLPSHSYAELLESGALVMDYMMPAINAIRLSATPEPTSGILLLMGLAVVGLRRRRLSAR